MATKIFRPVIMEKSPAVIQTATTSAPKIFFLMRRCLDGRKVACIRSKEIAARVIIDANGKKRKKRKQKNKKNNKQVSGITRKVDGPKVAIGSQ